MIKLTPEHSIEAQKRLIDILSIPSIGTDASFDADTQRCAEWVANHLKDSGFTDIQLLSRAGGHPSIVARTNDTQVENTHAPRVLFYGHYDVQPVEPLELWHTPPFKPVIKDNAIFARGASDDKGQVMCFLEALRAYHLADKKFPGPITLFIEGEEESEARTLPVLLAEEKELLAADIAVISDTAMCEGQNGPQPAITTALRGTCYFDIRLHGPSRDLHSGIYGGMVANPATQLTRILGRLHNDQGEITIPHFYDDVPAVDSVERDSWDKLDFNAEDMIAEVGGTNWGEKGYDAIERNWARPCCDINGIFGGYMGEGGKTVIPSWAGAKISFRLPPGMNAAKVTQQFTDWFTAEAQKAGCKAEVLPHGEGGSPIAVSTQNPYMQAACTALKEVSNQEVAFVRCGGSIPVVAALKSELGLDTLLVGFGLNSDALHSPNENFGLDRFSFGIRAHIQLLQSLAEV